MKARIHSQVLSFSFPFASRYKVGKPTNYAGSGPVAVRNQIDAYSGLLVGLLIDAHLHPGAGGHLSLVAAWNSSNERYGYLYGR